ncbi:MAG: long-chain fatty acid--CoA ligase [Candidatus Marinimicrobia bacterium]|nr:long-chain fatty acid--CoA ligase [Candidatus Neomarinimicrobiota bacterium]
MSYQLNYLKTMPDIFADALLGGTLRKLYNVKRDGEWKSFTYQDAYDTFSRIGFGLYTLGVKAKDKVGILSENRPEWSMTDWACAYFGFVSVPIYQTSVPSQIEYIINHSECKVVIASSKEQVKKIISIKSKLTSLKYVVVLNNDKYDDNWIISYDELLKKGDIEKEKSKLSMEEIAEKIKPDDLWSIVYTSGTSGVPKGVMTSHFNIAANVQQTQSYIGFEKDKRWLSFLPLSHSFERVTSLFSLWIGAEIYFAESITKVAENMREVKPQYMTTVPRLLDKIYSIVLERVTTGSPVKQKIFHWAQQVGQETVQKYLMFNKQPKGLLATKYSLAKKLVFNKIADIFGGEFIRCVSGGAPLSGEVGEFFTAASICIIEGYGLTEMSPVTHANDSNHIKFGTVGKALPDIQTKILEDGEILLNGPNRMEKYYNNPEETAEAIDKDGWFHTGDIGYIDEDGYLKITDRKKNLIVTAGGKNIAPAAVERAITSSKYVEQAVVIGDRRKFLVVILVPFLENIEKWGKRQDPPLEFNTYEDIVRSKAVEKLLKDELAANQQELARYEQIKYFFIAPQPFTIETGELTASMKVKRNEIIERYSVEIEELYKN